MVFDKKYVYYFNDFYIWFGECNGKTYFEISNKQFQECDLRRISLNNAGYYDEFTYIWFGKGIYKIDEINSTATQVIDNIYNVYFLFFRQNRASAPPQQPQIGTPQQCVLNKRAAAQARRLTGLCRSYEDV